MSEETQTTEEVQATSPEITPSVDAFKVLFETFYKDITKFYAKKTASAGARARKSLSALAKQAKVVRKEIQDQKRSNSAARKAAKAAVSA